jgi:ubiquinone biosynthesis protein
MGVVAWAISRTGSYLTRHRLSWRPVVRGVSIALRVLKEAFQDLNRLRQIATVVARHGFGAYLERTRLAEMLGRREVEPAAGEATPVSGEPATDRRTAARFRQLLADLGPTFIKLGQILSSRPDMLPSHWIEELSQLQDSCPPLPMTEIRKEIERGLGRTVESCFAELSETPLASASIAQVHRARTHQGAQVVVKVQRPRIRERVEADLDLLYYLARLLEAVVEETGIYTPTGVIEEFDRAIHEELDFSNEARNAREMAVASSELDFLVIPKVHDQLSSATVLTLDFVEGVKVSEVSAETGHDLEKLARHLIEIAFRQLFHDGIFHGDPHPGNVLILPEDRIALLDFGLVGRLTRPMQEALVTFIMGVALRDPETVARVLYRIGIPDAHEPITAFRTDISGILDRYLGLKLDEIRATSLLQDLLDLAIRHRIRIPKDYALLSKASIGVEGMIRRLYPKLDILEIGLPYARELLLARFNPTDAGSALMKSLLKFQTLAEDVPVQLSQILMDLEAGKLRVKIHSEELERIATNIRSLGLTLFLGILASGLTIGGLLVVVLGGPTPAVWPVAATQPPPTMPVQSWWHGVPTLGLVALLLAGMLFGAALTFYVVGGRFKKLSLRRFLTK